MGSAPADTLLCGDIVRENSFNNRTALLCRPSQTDASVAYVNNDHPAHFGDTFLVIIDINGESLLIPSTEETAILQHLPKKRPWTRTMWKLSASATHPLPPFGQTTFPQSSCKTEVIWNLAKIQHGGQEPLRRIACSEPGAAAAAQCGVTWPTIRPSTTPTHWIAAPLNIQ